MPPFGRASVLGFICVCACGEGVVPVEPTNQPSRQGLAPLLTPCLFTPASGAMTIVLAASELAHVERRLSDSALLVNGVTCDGGGTFAKSTTALRATVSGDVSGGETLLLDFTNGLFLKGSATAAAVSINLGGGGTDVLQLRGSPIKDTMRAGALGWDTTGDGLRDLTVTNVSSVIVTLGDGDDVFPATGGGNLGGPSSSSLALTVYGGPGKDTLTGGDGDDSLFGDSGNDTLSGGTSELDADTY